MRAIDADQVSYILDEYIKNFKENSNGSILASGIERGMMLVQVAIKTAFTVDINPIVEMKEETPRPKGFWIDSPARVNDFVSTPRYICPTCGRRGRHREYAYCPHYGTEMNKEDQKTNECSRETCSCNSRIQDDLR